EYLISPLIHDTAGSIPAGNYIQLPRTTTQSLGLTGRFLYFMFKPLPSKYFVIHVDTVSEDGLVVRVSFSNLFKFKSTSTWLQFPFACQPAKAKTNFMGPAPHAQKWTVLVLDMHYILSMYINRKFSHIKNLRICANILIKNCFTSDISYDPRISVDQARLLGITSVDENAAPMPRDMNFFLPKSKEWDDCYDIVRFPLDTPTTPVLPFDAIRRSDTPLDAKRRGDGPLTSTQRKISAMKTKHSNSSPGIISNGNLRCKSRGLPFEPHQHGCSDEGSTEEGEAQSDIRSSRSWVVDVGGFTSQRLKLTNQNSEFERSNQNEVLQPDPILKLRKVIGFGGQKSSFITSHSLHGGNDIIVYACNSVIVAMETATGHQHFFIGHTEDVSAIAFNKMQGAAPCILASAQSGAGGIVRIWKFESQECLAVIRSQNATAMNLLSFSSSGAILVGVGRDGHGKNLFMVWDTSGALRHGSVTVIAKAHTDVEILRIAVSPIDDTRMLSCGRDNLRFWRVRSNQLRSCPVAMPTDRKIGDFSDVTFARSDLSKLVSHEVSVYACTKAGYIIEVDFHKVTIRSIHKFTCIKYPLLLTGIALNSIRFTESFVATCSDDGFLRLWALDLSAAFIEAEHEGPVVDVDVTPDGVKVLAATAAGTLGYLDVATRKYTTLMRSHTDVDHTIRVWDIDTLRQLYDFATVDESPTALACHPMLEIFACGFATGTVRVFHVSSTSVISEHPQVHGGSKVTSIVFTASGERLISACEKGTMAMFDTTDIEKAGAPMLRVLTKCAARGDHGPRGIATSPDGRWIAFIGPNEFTITVASSTTLNQVMRVDVSTGVNLDPDILGQRSKIDAPLRITFTPPPANHLVVVTKSHRLLKLDAKTGTLVSVVDNIHRGNTGVVCVSDDCCHLVTTGDKLIKVWDYHRTKEVNYQAFIGHSSPIHRVMFTPDRLSLISASEGAIFIWDFMGAPPKPWLDATHVINMGRSKREDLLESARRWDPRESPPAPTKTNESGWVPPETLHASDLDASEVSEFTLDVDHLSHENHLKSSKIAENRALDAQIPTQTIENPSSAGENVENIDGVPVKLAWSLPKHDADVVEVIEEQINCDVPTVLAHFKAQPNDSQPATRTYTASAGEEGLKLRAVVGYNGNGRNNLIWNPHTGVLAYSCGTVVVIEILQTSEKRYFNEHDEEISCLAIQHDGQILASASASNGLIQSKICLLDVHTGACKAMLSHHEHGVVDMGYSKDDRFLITIGDYRDNTIVVWSSFDGEFPPVIMASIKTVLPINKIVWDHKSPYEFVTVGCTSSVLFWILEDSVEKVNLKLHEGEFPESIKKETVHCTSACYSEDGTLYVGTNNGTVTAWDTSSNQCFHHWRADSDEIILMQANAHRLLVAGASKSARIWSLGGSREEMKLEHELTFDGEVVSGSFDDEIVMGVLGTTNSSVWYVDWRDGSTIRLVAGHKHKVCNVSIFTRFDKNGHFATCTDGGVVRLWSEDTLEVAAQFKVADESCGCVVFSHPIKAPCLPNMVASGYTDGTIRVFDIDKLILKLKIQPHGNPVTSLQFSPDNTTLLSGDTTGLIAVTSIATGVTLRMLRDHKGAPINNIEVSMSEVISQRLSLICSADRRVSVWDTEWQHDICEMLDWLTFPAPCFAPDGTQLDLEDKLVPPCHCKFHPTNPDLLIYCGYGLNKSLELYSLTKRKVVQSIPMSNWAQCVHLHGPLCVAGTASRLVELIDVAHGTFQDYASHGRDVTQVRFSPSGKLLISAAGGELFVWDVCVG
uniref:CFA20 domain-containing protein n=1 Tax=Ciona savignyi TaxID=51511 RepID=H2ZR20_CIOSA